MGTPITHSFRAPADGSVRVLELGEDNYDVLGNAAFDKDE